MYLYLATIIEPDQDLMVVVTAPTAAQCRSARAFGLPEKASPHVYHMHLRSSTRGGSFEEIGRI